MRIRVVYSGRVQGVGFRATAAWCAKGLPVSGFVRNLADGTVLLEAQGAATEIDTLLARIADRMGRNINRADRAEVPEHAGERAFEVRR
ncbi:MAG: acylphosphatase [Phycisphaeraceae bacterium]|nr:acylphosphatase [Phycisphaeraceae bacterium]